MSSTRERKPSAKARDLAAFYGGGPAVPAARTSSKPKPKAKTSSGVKGKRVWSQYDEDDAPLEQLAPPATTNDYDAPKAYCVCLGDDDSTPMIQCEGCDNWYHFRCIDLHEEEAKSIKKYFCENCHAAGLGTTKHFGDGGSPSPVPEDDKRDLAYDSLGDSPTSEDEENAPIQAIPSRKRASGSGSKRSKKRAKAEGTSDEDDDDDPAYTGDFDVDVDIQYAEKPEKPKRKGSSTTARTISDKRSKLEALASKRRGSSNSAPKVSSDPAASRTRQGVKTQLIKALADIYTAGEPSTGRIDVDDIEMELFILTAEPDEKNALAPRNKYTTKFRSLFQNLRSNAYLRSRIAGTIDEPAITAASLVNMTAEDLLTPEQRALAQQVQEKSMRDSIKSAIEAPKAKVTHKGEEVIDDLATTDDRVDVRRSSYIGAGSPIAMSPPHRHNSFGGSPPMSPTAPSPPSMRQREDSYTGIPDQAFSPRDDTLMGPPPLPRSASGPVVTADDDWGDALIQSPVEDRSASAPAVAPSQSPVNRVSFDLDSVWGSFKPTEQSPPGPDASKEDDDQAMDVDDSPADSPKNAYSDFVPPSASGSRDAEADLDAILRIEPTSSSASGPSASASAPLPSAPAVPAAIPIERLAPIWDGQVDSPDEVKFPAFAVQVAGRLLGTSRDYWQRVVPPNVFKIEGRLATHTASEYLVQNTFSQTRELVVLALLPDLSGPNPAQPTKPPAARAQADYATLIKSLSGRKRTAVILPQDRQKKAVKDIYLYPLLKTEPVPDFVELLEAHALGEGKERDRDYLLLVAVLQKGMLPPPVFENMAPMPGPPPPAGMPTPPTGGFSAAGGPNPFANLDPSLVQALLAQPQLLQSLTAQMPPSQPANFPPLPPQQQVSNLLNNLDPSVLGALLKQPGGAASPVAPHHQQQGGQSPPPQPLGMAINPERMRMMQDGGRGQHGGQHNRQGSGGRGYR